MFTAIKILGASVFAMFTASSLLVYFTDTVIPVEVLVIEMAMAWVLVVLAILTQGWGKYSRYLKTIGILALLFVLPMLYIDYQADNEVVSENVQRMVRHDVLEGITHEVSFYPVYVQYYDDVHNVYLTARLFGLSEEWTSSKIEHLRDDYFAGKTPLTWYTS